MKHKHFLQPKSIFVAAIIIVFVAVIGCFIWGDEASRSREHALTKEVATSDCQTGVDALKTGSNEADLQYDWKLLTHETVLLSDWGVTMKLPKDLVGRVVCRTSTEGYIFSMKDIVENQECVDYYRKSELAAEGVSLYRYPGTTSAERQIFASKGTLDDYYKKHKANDGNYIEKDDIKFYKIGKNFYVLFTISQSVENPEARDLACDSNTFNFELPLREAIATIKES